MRISLIACLAMVLSASQERAAEPLKPEAFNQLHALIKPQESEEKFMKIPWQTDLWQARKQAAAQARPILLWEMDGHPLGCV